MIDGLLLALSPTLLAMTLAGVCLGIIWGSNFIFMKWATDYITPLQIVFIRVVFGFLPIALYALARRQLRLTHLRHLGHFIVMAALAAVIYYYGFARGTALLTLWGSNFPPAANAAMACLFESAPSAAYPPSAASLPQRSRARN